MLSHLYCGRELRSSSISSQIRQTLSTVDSTMLTILLICRAERMPIRANNITETLKMMQVLLRCLICFSRFSIEWRLKYSEVYKGLSPTFCGLLQTSLFFKIKPGPFLHKWPAVNPLAEYVGCVLISEAHPAWRCQEILFCCWRWRRISDSWP